MIAVGVDVAEERKGLDLVAFDLDRHVVANHGRLTVDGVAGLVLDKLRPAIVCIDSPAGWSRSGRSRQAERDLARLRISAFATGADPGDHPFYKWMRVGFSVFEAVADRYPLFRGDEPYGRAAEVYPNASASFLAGRSRGKAESKVEFRRQVLRTCGVDDAPLRGIDRVDAALAALTGLLAVEGRWTCVGDPDEGVILLPATNTVPLPAVISRRSPPGHDAELRSELLVAWRAGDQTAAERLRYLG
jgi:predicted nuclease with RNAse H fold